MRVPRPRLPARFRRFGKKDTWAWHAATAAEAIACWLGFASVSDVARPLHDRLVNAAVCVLLVAVLASWKSGRRALHRVQRELAHTQDNAAWLQERWSELADEHRAVLEELRRARNVPLATLCVSPPVPFRDPAGQDEFAVVPVYFHGDSPHDPAGYVVTVNLPPGAPWHTES